MAVEQGRGKVRGQRPGCLGSKLACWSESRGDPVEAQRRTEALGQGNPGAKHDASLQKQQNAGAKIKAKAGQKPSAASESQAPVAAETSTTTTSTNSEYYECVKQDMAVIEKVLGSKLKNAHAHCSHDE